MILRKVYQLRACRLRNASPCPGRSWPPRHTQSREWRFYPKPWQSARRCRLRSGSSAPAPPEPDAARARRRSLRCRTISRRTAQVGRLVPPRSGLRPRPAHIPGSSTCRGIVRRARWRRRAADGRSGLLGRRRGPASRRNNIRRRLRPPQPPLANFVAAPQ